MNTQIEELQKRRSIRRYTTEAITEEEYDLILKTAMFAPTAKSLQPWHFLLVTDRSLLLEITKVHPYASMLEYAPGAVLVCGDRNIQEEDGYLILDGAAATMNILHAAHALHIGSCWLGIYPKQDRMERISALFHLPSSIMPISLVALGKTEVEKPLPLRDKPERIHRNKW
ncbi:MAG: nitroreductase family protein [Bacteroidales bacterium]